MRDNSERDTGRQSVWATYLSQIDAEIEKFAAQAGSGLIDNFAGLEQHVREWLDRQDLDDKARWEWATMKANSRLLQARIKQRYNVLVKRGRIRIAHWTSAGRRD